eukprot:4739062-Prymnesium_polylepis.1
MALLSCEDLRETPQARMGLVLRPGYRDRARAMEERRQEQLDADARATLKWRDARIQATRDSLACRRKDNASAAVQGYRIAPSAGRRHRVTVAAGDDAESGTALADLASFEARVGASLGHRKRSSAPGPPEEEPE